MSFPSHACWPFNWWTYENANIWILHIKTRPQSITIQGPHVPVILALSANETEWRSKFPRVSIVGWQSTLRHSATTPNYFATIMNVTVPKIPQKEQYRKGLHHAKGSYTSHLTSSQTPAILLSVRNDSLLYPPPSSSSTWPVLHTSAFQTLLQRERNIDDIMSAPVLLHRSAYLGGGGALRVRLRVRGALPGAGQRTGLVLGLFVAEGVSPRLPFR